MGVSNVSFRGFSRPSPKRSMSCAGLDELDELLHGVDHVSAHPRRKRHQSLTSDNNVVAASFAPSSSPSRPPFPPPPASYPGALRRPDLLAFGEAGSTGGFALGPSTSPPFEPRYCRTPSNQLQIDDYHRHSDEQSNNYEQDEYDEFNDEFGSVDAGYGGYRDHEDSGSFSAASPTPREPQEELEQRLKQRRGHLLPPSYRPSTSECSPREDFLVQAFGPSGFKLHGAVSSTGDDEGDDCGSTHSFSSGSSNNNREHHSSSGEAEAVDPDTELKMSFSELEADIRGAMHHHHQQHYQQTSKLPELADLSRQSSSSSSHGQFGLNGGSSSKSGNNQDGDRVAAFGQAQAPLLSQEGAVQLQPSSRPTSGQSKGNGGVQTSTKWLRDEDERLRSAVARFSGKNWKMIAETLGNGRTDVQCLHRWNKVLKPGLIKGPWTPEEDRVLLSLITRYGVGKIRWCDLALHLPGRIGKQCRERWCNHLDSRIRKGQWTPEEDDTVFCWQQKLGNKWSEIAKMLPGRTENAVKNRFNSAARRKWLMNQANKPHSAAPAELNPPHPLQPTSLPHERTGYNSSSHPYSYNAGDVKVAPLPRSTPLVMPASAALMEGQRQPKFTLPVGHQLSIFRAPVPVGDDQSFLPSEPERHAEAGNRNGSAALAPPPTFVPPPLNALLLPPASAPTGNAVMGGYNRNFHHLLSGPIGSGGSSSSLFPFASHLPIQQPPIDAVRSTRFLPEDLSDREHSRAAAFPPLHLSEVKLERNDLVCQSPEPTTGAVAAPDAGVAMDDENMSSFLDSVALELDDIME
ncbi:hypothetical protein BBJ28_00014562 [Nothophytophthora sp. Chile5]|nr:hypothetical protein BBJ28_00014562 [Nothophytophthora sp. Chile5]